MTSASVVLASLGSTGFAALGTALKHRSATRLSQSRKDHPPGVARLVARSATEPLWLCGLLADGGAVGLQVYALHIGALAVVQPLLVTALLFSLVLNHVFDRTFITAKELGWAVTLIASLATFLTVSGAASPATSGPAQAADKVPAEAAAILAVVVVVACLAAARRRPRVQRAALFGVAVGFIYASTAALIKACTDIAARSPSALLTSWQLYVLLVAGATGLICVQLAFHAGPLTASLPVIAAVDPVLSVALGVLVYDERLRGGPWTITVEAASLMLLASAAFALSRVRAIADEQPTRTPRDRQVEIEATAAEPAGS